MHRWTPVLFFWSVFCALVGAQADYKKFYDDDKLPMVQQLYDLGRYSIVIQNCDYALRRGQPSPLWRILKMKSLAQIGENGQAIEEADSVVRIFPGDLASLLEVHDIYRSNGKNEQRDKNLALINAAASAVPKKEREALELVHLGRAALLLGADPAMVLEKYYSPAKSGKKKGNQAPPGVVEAHQAGGELALAKSDFQLAAEEFRAGLKYLPNHPDLRFGLARAFLPDNRKEGMAEIEKILEANPFHFGALLTKAEYAINFERFGEARSYLMVIHGINPRQPEAWALNAVLEELEKNDKNSFNQCRARALENWAENPEIDHLIGRVLSRNYRFREGADSQQRSLRFDPNFLPAKLQLAVDFLRLGDEEAAWPLVREVAAADQYNVLAYNLEILQKEIESFDTVKSEHFIIRLPAHEAALYGDRAASLLEEAHALLCPKYGVTLEQPTLVEFFPDQNDFAIRSFGSLGGAGLLGVCFGSVITMNSPGSLGHGKNNWEATLWHEFAHVVTLTATKNKMPRWLSEGISVYEEMEKQSNWGQRMTPAYRKMILEDGELTPISRLSSAFQSPKSGNHVMFAYYESMVVVRFIVETYGFDALKKILRDLSDGFLINEAIARNTISMDELEIAFEKHIKTLAENLAPGVDWTIPDPAAVNPRSLLAVGAFLKKNPANHWAHQTYTEQLLEQQRWPEARESADALIALFPDHVDGISNGYFMKARACRSMKDETGEAEVLRHLSEKSAEAYSAYTQLMALDLKNENWAQLLTHADRAMAINPLLKDVHYCRGCALAELHRGEEAITSFEKLLRLNPVNPSEVRFRLAGLYQGIDPIEAKRHLLDSLADSPRYREAYQLLLSFEKEQGNPGGEKN